jgi:hypothetical protein
MKSKQFEEDAAVKVHRIRITLTSRNVKNLEKGAAALHPTALLSWGGVLLSRVVCHAARRMRISGRSRGQGEALVACF